MAWAQRVSNAKGFAGMNRIALVLSGGVALGAYHAGAYAVLEEETVLPVDWLAGSSIGAVTGAIIAGNPPGRRVERLRRFWDGLAMEPLPFAACWLGQPGMDTRWRRAGGWASALQTRLLGRPGMFRPRLLPEAEGAAPGLYDLAPLRGRLEEVIDFGLLNSGGEVPRLSVIATDILRGERVVFDTRHGGVSVGPDHLLASCALLPDFTPIEIGGRLLGDGGFSANAPLDLVLDEAATGQKAWACFVVDLFAREGGRPRSLADAAARALDLMFSSQSGLMLEGRVREHSLRDVIGRLAARLPPELTRDPEIAAMLAEGRKAGTATVLRLAYRAPAGEADIQKTFDFAHNALVSRWEAGARDMRAALRTLATLPRSAGGSGGGMTVHEVGADAAR
jgi:NTE family protein